MRAIFVVRHLHDHKLVRGEETAMRCVQCQQTSYNSMTAETER
jgi:hypothetical protein